MTISHPSTKSHQEQSLSLISKLLGYDKIFNLKANLFILVFSILVIFYLLRLKRRNNRDEENYDWTKFMITSIQNIKIKRWDNKERSKVRVKDFSKGNGFIKEEHKFSNSSISKLKPRPNASNGNVYLNYEEADNLQDMINFAASIKQNSSGNKEAYPIESLYLQAISEESKEKGNSNVYTNEKLDHNMATLLQASNMDEGTKINKILEIYRKLLRMNDKNLKQTTYIGLVECFIKNGYLSHASYFLCQMDRLKMNIPRSLLDLFLDYSISNGLFDKKEEEGIQMDNLHYDKDVWDNKIPNANSHSTGYNKYDDYKSVENEPEYAYYFSRRNNYKKRKNMNEVITNLKIDSEPFYPKSTENCDHQEDDECIEKMKQKLKSIDKSKIKEYIPTKNRKKE